MSSCSSTTSTTADHGGATSVATVDRDIIETHILTRLDGPTLASAASASRTMHGLCAEERLWRDICDSMWTSVSDPRVRHVISAFPAGYRSFFSDAFPSTFRRPSNSLPDHHRPSHPSELISAVDLHYENKLIFSKVEVTETISNDFTGPTLWIELLDPKETAPGPVKCNGFNNDFLSHLEQSMKLSWIMIDPTRKRAVNLSSLAPVAVRRHYMAGEVQLEYVKVLPGDSRVGSGDPVQCRIVVTCGGEEGGEMHVREVNMDLQDMDGLNLSWEESLVILQGAMGCERRKEVKGKERYEKFIETKRDRRERKEKRERTLDTVCTILRVLIFLTLLCGAVVFFGSNKLH